MSKPDTDATLVSRQESDSLIAGVSAGAEDANLGIFGPASVSWKINRESALFLGAGRAALLQLAHPWVATALQQHSSLMEQPIARFHNTFRIVFTMIFGSLRQATSAARHLYGLHTRIQGEMKEDVAAYARGSHYEANEIAALRWVYATLVESAVLAYQVVMPPLTPDELEAYYAESKILAALFGLPGEALPHRWDDFLQYCRAMEQSEALGVTSEARVMAQGLLAGSGSRIKPPAWYRALTIGWLPPRFRGQFGLTYGSAESDRGSRARRWLPRLYRRIPAPARYVGPWHEAQSRLAGRSPQWLASFSNRFWIGQPSLPFAEE